MRRFIYILSLLLIASSCKKEDNYPSIEVFGHAGAGINISNSPYQENSIEAIKYALNYSEISGVEIDLQWSKDGTPWLYHDNELALETNAEGKVSDKTDEELSEVRYKGLNQEKLVKLTDVAGLIGDRQLILDLKLLASGNILTLQEIQDGLSDFVALAGDMKVTVILQNMDYSVYFQSLGWGVYLNVNSVSDYYSIPQWENSVGCCISNSNIESNEVENLHTSHKKVIIFSARAPKTIRRALKKRPDIFMADDIRSTLIEKIR